MSLRGFFLVNNRVNNFPFYMRKLFLPRCSEVVQPSIFQVHHLMIINNNRSVVSGRSEKWGKSATWCIFYSSALHPHHLGTKQYHLSIKGFNRLMPAKLTEPNKLQIYRATSTTNMQFLELCPLIDFKNKIKKLGKDDKQEISQLSCLELIVL